MSAPVKLGIIAGGGALPFLVAQAALRQGRDVHIIGIAGETAAEHMVDYPHSWIKWGQFGRLFKSLKSNECGEVVIIGSVTRPDMNNVRFDFGAIRTLPFILSLMVGGDDAILSRIVGYFEKKGYVIRGAHEIAPELVAQKGCLTRKRPSSKDSKDMDTAFRVVRALGELDVGQSAVVSRNYVLAVEAAEGTDAMLKRATELRQWGRRGRKGEGVFVKCPKPGQELRIDMPTVGARTVQLVADAGLSGIALEAQGVLLADREEMIRLANEQGIFIVGV